MLAIEKYNPIFITGIERSGSSIIAKIIQESGVFFGDVNPMYENKVIKQEVSLYYAKNGWDITGQYPLPDLTNIKAIPDWKESIYDALLFDGYADGLWGYKSGRIGQIWPIWNAAFPDAKWIIVRRRSADVINSCQKTAYMTAFESPSIREAVNANTDRDGWLWWIHQHEQNFRDMVEAGVNCRVIWPERILDGDYSQIYDMLDWLGIPCNKEILKTLNSALIK